MYNILSVVFLPFVTLFIAVFFNIFLHIYVNTYIDPSQRETTFIDRTHILTRHGSSRSSLENTEQYTRHYCAGRPDKRRLPLDFALFGYIEIQAHADKKTSILNDSWAGCISMWSNHLLATGAYICLQHMKLLQSTKHQLPASIEIIEPRLILSTRSGH